MKKRIFLVGLFLPIGILHAQTPITNLPGAATNGNGSNQYWSRAGNTNGAGQNNVLGTLYDSPIWLQTNGVNRVQFFSTQGTAAPAWVSPLPYGGGMAINLNPADPIRNPLSLLHIGEPTQSGQHGGYRSWMQVGTYYGHFSDQLYIGMKAETSTVADRGDAVINWGDNTNLVGTPDQYGPDYLRVIFTAPRGATGYNTYAAGHDGLEVMRFQHDGSVGIGNFYNDALFPYRTPSRRLEILSNKTAATANGTPILRMTHTQQNPSNLTNTGKYIDFEPRATGDLVIQALDNTLATNPNRNFKERYVGINTPNPGNTVEINSQFAGANTPNGSGTATGWAGLRFTDLNSTSLTQTNPGTGVLSVNASGDVVYVESVGATGPAGPQGPAGPTGPAGPAGTAGGALCGSNYTIGRLTGNTRLNLSNNNYFFNNETPSPNPQFNRVAVGYLCTNVLPAKFNVYQKEAAPISFNSTASHAQVEDKGTTLGQYFIATRGLANGVQTVARITNNGGYFTGSNAPINYGVRGEAFSGFNNTSGFSYGGYLTAQDNSTAIGTRTSAINFGTNGISYGIYASGSGGQITRAGYFEGIVEAELYAQYSDSVFKIDVNKLSGGLKLLQALKPVSYKMDASNYPQMNFDDHVHFGYIAQDVEDVFPNLVYESYRPSDLDSTGTPIDSSVTYKSLNYNGFIPINTQAIIELNQKVDAISLSDESIKTNVQDLTGSLDKVLEMRGVSYDWDHTVHPELNLDSSNQIGFIAQEIQVIDPRLTFVADDSLLHVKYEKVVPILAEAIQELNGQVESKDSIIDAQQSQINDLNNRLTQLENCLSGILPYLCQLSHSAIKANTPEAQEEVRKNLNVTLSNRSAIVLDQNVPNPFAEQTVINFSIPETVKKAQIHFYDGNGRFMNSVEVTERGLGSVTVFGSDLSTGVYTYTLVADGQVVATKKMMKQ